MIRFHRFGLLVAFLFAAHLTAAAQMLVVSENAEHRAALINPNDFSVIAHLPTGKGPHEITVSRDGRLAFVADSGTGPNGVRGNTITVLDLAKRAVKATFDLGEFVQPHDTRVSRDGRWLWVTCAPARTILELDAESGKILKTYKIEQDGAWFLEATPDARKLYTANLEGKSICVIDRATGRVKTIPLDAAAWGIDVTPDGKEVWVCSSAINIIDTATDQITATLPVGGKGAYRIKLTADGKLAVVSIEGQNQLALFDVKSRQRLATIELTTAPKVMTISSDGRRAFLSNPADNQITVVDLVAHKQLTTFPVGKTPDGIAWAELPLNRNRSLPIEEGYVATEDGTRLFYQKAGRGAKTLLLPGRLFTFEEFRQLADRYTIIAYDMRGRGRSDAIPDEQKAAKLGIHHDVKDLERIRQHFKVNRASLIGYSYLGLMVVLYAMEHPARVERIVQIGPVPIKFDTQYPDHLAAKDEPGDPQLRAELRRVRQENFHLTHPQEYCEMEWNYTRFGLVGNPANVHKLGGSLCAMPNEWPTSLVKHFEHSFVSVQKLDVPKSKIAQIRIPVLTIHGTRDRNAAYGAGREWAMILPNAHLLTVQDAAHQVFAEYPEIVFPAIRTFLQGRWPANVEKVKSLQP